MRSRAVILCGAAAVLLAGCGGSSHKTSSAPTSGTPSAPAASKPTSAMQGRLLTRNELSGFTGSPGSPDSDASRWVSVTDSGLSASQQAAEVKRLTKLGFVVGDSEDLSDGAFAGLSSVERFKTAQEAQVEVNYEAAQFSKNAAGQGTISAFRVPGIPGALGYAVVNGGTGGVNISFAKGPYAYVAGQELLAGETLNTAKSKLMAAAEHEHARASP
jgi:hypothetical protein